MMMMNEIMVLVAFMGVHCRSDLLACTQGWGNDDARMEE